MALFLFVCIVLFIFGGLWRWTSNEFFRDNKMIALKKEFEKLKEYNRKLLKENIELHNKNTELTIELEKGEKKMTLQELTNRLQDLCHEGHAQSEIGIVAVGKILKDFRIEFNAEGNEWYLIEEKK